METIESILAQHNEAKSMEQTCKQYAERMKVQKRTTLGADIINYVDSIGDKKLRAKHTWGGVVVYHCEDRLLEVEGIQYTHRGNDFDLRLNHITNFEAETTEQSVKYQKMVLDFIQGNDDKGYTGAIDLYKKQQIEYRNKKNQLRQKLFDLQIEELLNKESFKVEMDYPRWEAKVGGFIFKKIEEVSYKKNPSGRSGTLIIKARNTSTSGMVYEKYALKHYKGLLESYCIFKYTHLYD